MEQSKEFAKLKKKWTNAAFTLSTTMGKECGLISAKFTPSAYTFLKICQEETTFCVHERDLHGEDLAPKPKGVHKNTKSELTRY